MKQYSWIFVGLVLTVASATAQGPATTGAPSVALSFAHLALGAPGLEDDCTILETSAPGAGASINDLRASECQGKAAGTLLQDSDTVELTAAATNPALSLAYADLNANGRYDPGDAVYLDTDPAPGLTPSTSPTAFTLRVLAAAGHPAGTYVRAGDSDLVAYGASAATFATASLAWTDPDASATFTAGDVAYILPNVAPGYAAGGLVPQSAIRVSFAPPPSPRAPPPPPP
ncbi:MAG: hypothetical protein QOG31_1164, partial [Thermoplasmata archaeon]|nr:hypothetical protein [Thermoplasmata archaeon]